MLTLYGISAYFNHTNDAVVPGRVAIQGLVGSAELMPGAQPVGRLFVIRPDFLTKIGITLSITAKKMGVSKLPQNLGNFERVLF